MIQTLSRRHQVVRVRPVTFAYTRPLSPADVSGLTGRMVTADAAETVSKASLLQDALLKVKGFFRA